MTLLRPSLLLDAYALLGQLAESTVANIVDPNYTVIAKFPKRYHPC